MITMVFDEANIGIEDVKSPPAEEGGEPQLQGYVIALIDPQSGITVKCPLALENARQIGNYLLGKATVQVARAGEMPPTPPDSILQPKRR